MLSVSVINTPFRTMRSRILFILSFFCTTAFAAVDIDFINNTIKSYAGIYGTDSPEYADAVLWAAAICADNNDCVQAKVLLSKSDSLFIQYGKGPFAGRDTVSQILHYEVLKNIEDYENRIYFAIKHARESLALKEKYYGEKSIPALNSYLDLSRLYAEKGRNSKSVSFHNKGYLGYVELLKKEFCSSTETQRIIYWDKASRYIYRTLTQADNFPNKYSASYGRKMYSAAYDAALLSKGILLNTTLGFDNFIKESGLAAADSLLRQKKLMQDRGAAVPLLDSLDNAILHILADNGKEYYIPHLSITWKNVADKLGDNDIAIEFYKTIAGTYGALIVGRGWRSPRLIPLKSTIKYERKTVSTAAALETLITKCRAGFAEDKALTWALSRAIWTDEVLKYFPKDINAKIYFSVDGLLQFVALENLPFDYPSKKDYTMGDIFNLYRLSSTRELVTATKITGKLDSAVLYGGLQYKLNDTTMINESRKYARVNRSASFSKRKSFEKEYINPLEKTMEEIDTIESILLNKTDSKVKKRYGKFGNEESFKAMSQNAPQLLHVASHGFYADVKGEGLAATDLSMQNTGLLLSGAQQAFSNGKLPDDVEDGILTSFEIAHLDLSGMETVVLSACETALGEITADGVAGLQRGFKQAGANSILMSLWDVDDEATCLLMKEFYTHWISHKQPKRTALENAKLALRRSKDWSDYKYWGAFILLDAIY